MAPTVSLPPTTGTRKFGLLVLNIFCSPLALYLDGAGAFTIFINFVLYLSLLLPFAIIHGIVYIFRSDEHRAVSKPLRRTLKNKLEAAEKETSDDSPPRKSIAPAPTNPIKDSSPQKSISQAPTNPFEDPTPAQRVYTQN